MKSEVFDETFLQLNLKGGSIHTELLQVEAEVIKGKGQYKGQSLPLKCQWFNITKNNDFIEIQDLSGQYYQPCILDVDTKIMVQAIPILDQEYQGMPICKETNLIQMDQRVNEKVKEYFQQGFLEVQCKLESGNLLDDVQMPIEIQLTISENELRISYQNRVYELQGCEYRIIKKSNNQLQIQNGDKRIMIVTKNNIERDIIYQFQKTVKGKSIDKSQLYLTISDQQQQIKDLEDNCMKLNEQMIEYKQKIKELQYQILQQNKKQEQLERLQQQMISKSKELDEIKTHSEKLDGKNQFYQQEIKVLKSQIINLETTNKRYHHTIEELKKQQHESQDEIREMAFREKIDALKHSNDKLLKENQQWQLVNDQLLKEMKILQNELKLNLEEKEKYQNELNSFKRKYESLTQEVNKQDSAPISEIHSLREQDDEQIEEIKRLKQTIINLEQTLKNLKYNYEQDMLKIVNGKQFIKQNQSQEIQILQKLANSLAESLTDKETALQNQRNINKELLNQIEIKGSIK